MAQILDLDAEWSCPPRPPLTIFAIAAPGAAADEVIVLIIDEQVQIAAAIPGDAAEEGGLPIIDEQIEIAAAPPGDACLGQRPAAEHDAIDVGSTGLDG